MMVWFLMSFIGVFLKQCFHNNCRFFWKSMATSTQTTTSTVQQRCSQLSGRCGSCSSTIQA